MNIYLSKKITLALLLASPIYSLSVSDIAYAENTGGVIVKDEYTSINKYNYQGENTSNSDIVIDTPFTDGDKVSDVYGGYNAIDKNNIVVSGNTVTVNLSGDVDFKHDIYGGFNRKGKAEHNNVVINNGNFTENIYGATSQEGDNEYNTITINGGTFTGNNIYGGYISTESKNNVNYNKVVITDGNFEDITIRGGSHHGIQNDMVYANNNEVLITGGTFDQLTVDGAGLGQGYASGSANYNKVKIEGTKDNRISITGSSEITGGSAYNDGGAIGNEVNVKYIDVADNISFYGAHNTVSGDETDIDWQMNDNSVTIDNSEFRGMFIVYGANAKPDEPINRQMNNNKISISNSIIDNTETDRVEISGATMSSGGGYRDEYKFETSNNTVEINNSEISSKTIRLTGGSISTGNLNNNTVSIKDSIIQNIDEADAVIEIIGGKTTSSYEEHTATNNNVIIDNSIIGSTGHIAKIYAVDKGQDRDKLISDNNIIIKNNSNVEFTDLYGVYCQYGGDEITVPTNINNNLILENWAGKVNSVNNFNGIEFKNIKDEADVILNPTQLVNLTGVNIGVSDLDLSADSQHVLIQNQQNADKAKINIGNLVEENEKGVRVHDLTTEIDGDKLLLNVGRSILAGNYTDADGKSYGDNVLSTLR